MLGAMTCSDASGVPNPPATDAVADTELARLHAELASVRAELRASREVAERNHLALSAIADGIAIKRPGEVTLPLIKQYVALLKTEGVTLDFTEDAIDALARLAQRRYGHEGVGGVQSFAPAQRFDPAREAQALVDHRAQLRPARALRRIVGGERAHAAGVDEFHAAFQAVHDALVGHVVRGLVLPLVEHEVQQLHARGLDQAGAARFGELVTQRGDVDGVEQLGVGQGHGEQTGQDGVPEGRQRLCPAGCADGLPAGRQLLPAA
mgnify:CR=1 FL=1